MTTAADPLPTDLETAHQLIRELLETLRKQALLNAHLQHQIDKLLRRIYGSRSEKLDPNQLLLFAREMIEALGADPAATVPEDDAEPPGGSAIPADPPKKNGHGRKPLPKGLPRRRVVHDVPAEDLPCPDCGALRICIGEDLREQLEFVPASLVVIEHVRPKYACKSCEANVVIADRLPEPIEKGLPGPGLLAQIIVSKYADHLPLYRQEGIFRRHGVELPRQTTCDWMATCASLLEPIVKAMFGEIKKSRVIQTDDTPVPVLDRRLAKTRQGRLWIYRGDRDHPHVVYDYTPDRSGEGPKRMLEGYQGYLQADAYSAYDALYAGKTIIEVGCWAHARRKFDEAKTSDAIRAHVALALIQRLYQVEKSAKELDDAARQALRQERSRPILAEIHAWLLREQEKVLRKSPIGEAIGYALNHWKALGRYLEAGWLSIDNNASERGMKPVAIGRKNWLFAGSDAGGKTAAILMSLCVTCKELGIDAFVYLRDVLDRISTHPNSRLNELLPDQWQKLRAPPAGANPVS
jgi:transposase